MKLSDLPDIEFVSSNKDEVEAMMLETYKRITGRRLTDGDPIRLFISTIAYIIILLLNKINETGKQNLLKYAKGNNLDHLGVLVGVARTPAARAATTVKATLSIKRDVVTIIPKGTRITAGDNVFFEIESDISILAGSLVGEGKAFCTEVGKVGNGYYIHELNMIVDPVPYVQSIVNVTTTEGGADIEEDERYRERIHAAPESFSCAGAEGAYSFFAKKASTTIADVIPISPAPGEVVLYCLLENGVVPEKEILDKVVSICSQKHVRPLTDKVRAAAPSVKKYSIGLTYYINREDTTQVALIQQAVDKAINDYIIWQRAQMGRDINPSELIQRIMRAGAKRVIVTNPIYEKVKNGSKEDNFIVEIAVLDKKNVLYGGIEDE